MTTDVYSDGTLGSPRFEEYIYELGRATWEASVLAMYSYNLLRVFGGISSASMDDDTMGQLVNRLRGLLKSHSDWPELGAFVADLDEARRLRNDLMHALPVHHGLHRRRRDDRSYVRNFFTVASLKEVSGVFDALNTRANELLYRDDGAAVKAWYEARD